MYGLLGAFSNCIIRGGGIDYIFPGLSAKLKGLRWINALIFGGALLYHSHDYRLALTGLAGMAAGQSFGLSSYIGAMLGTNPSHGRLWGFLMMTLRGAIWVACLLPMAYFINWHILYFLPAALLMGAVYYSMILLFNGYSKGILNFWPVSEIIYGIILWAPIYFL